MPRHQLTDEQWECIGDLLPKSARTGRPPADRRMILNAIFLDYANRFAVAGFAGRIRLLQNRLEMVR